MPLICKNSSTHFTKEVICQDFELKICFFVCNRGYNIQYHNGLRSRELGQARARSYCPNIYCALTILSLPPHNAITSLFDKFLWLLIEMVLLKQIFLSKHLVAHWNKLVLNFHILNLDTVSIKSNPRLFLFCIHNR